MTTNSKHTTVSAPENAHVESLPELHFTAEERESLAKIFADPYRNAELIAAARQAVASIPVRDVPEAERL